MTTKTTQEHIALHCRGGAFNPEKTVDQNISVFNLQCLIGMIETGEITYDDLDAVGGMPLVAAVAKSAGTSHKGQEP